MKRALIALIALAFVSPVMAQVGLEPEDPPPGVVAAHNQVVRFLDLSEDQVAAWDLLWQTHLDEERPLEEIIADIQAELEALFETPDPDPAAVGALVLERRTVGEELHHVHMVYHEGFVALLDEEQTQRLSFINHADDVQRFIPAFKHFQLIPRR
jgi:hypothetical protein